MNRDRRNPHDFGSLFDGQATEEAQLDTAAVVRFQGGEFFKRVIERDQLDFGLAVEAVGIAQRETTLAAAAFSRLPAARMINQDIANQMGGQSEELRAMLPVDALLLDQSQIDFVDNDRRLQRDIRRLAAQVAFGESAKLIINQRHQLIARQIITITPFQEKFADCVVFLYIAQSAR